MTEAPLPRAARPFRLDLDQQRKRAKDLARAARRGDRAALRRFRAHHPDAAMLDGPPLPPSLARLAAAQLVVARELGLPSWPRLVAHFRAMAAARLALGAGAPPDAGEDTLHLRCGSDIAPMLRRAGFAGAFLEYADPLCQGPVLPREDWLQHRVAFLMEACGEILGLEPAALAARRLSEEAALAAAARRRRVVLWFEHDSHDQLILARCLAQFAANPPARLELVVLDRFPGAARFIGLGQMPPEALRLLWRQRRPLGPAALKLGAAVWDALRAPEPAGLLRLARSGAPALPHLAPALRRHCQELPDSRTGLGLTERLILESLAERSRSLGAVFQDLTLRREPMPWLGDVLFRHLLNRLRQGHLPLLRGSGGAAAWAQEELELTEAGRAVLAGALDWLALRPPARWLGGIRLTADAPCWRWDAAAEQVMLQPPAPERRGLA
ncbi:DUF1835 domain-containing protein [Roseomonas sp. E05]|uniref:DUF1835 domain-containing protein n=1 Tax=Roseomonas sp. E05 TaxID=3046310 RepID=UPI0024BA50E1|nr:DUF1835 domain-containing protein [Roseomonas sp. E05]MDJ0388389.1 DUF1835 domain-containing protein [Roseomonas sp. E05]